MSVSLLVPGAPNDGVNVAAEPSGDVVNGDDPDQAYDRLVSPTRVSFAARAMSVNAAFAVIDTGKPGTAAMVAGGVGDVVVTLTLCAAARCAPAAARSSPRQTKMPNCCRRLE